MSKKKNEEEDRKLDTCQPDPRFPNQNVSSWCFSLFMDYHKCTRLLGAKHEPCQYFYKCFHSICPNAWISRWEEQLDNGTFPAKLPDKEK